MLFQSQDSGILLQAAAHWVLPNTPPGESSRKTESTSVKVSESVER